MFRSPRVVFMLLAAAGLSAALVMVGRSSSADDPPKRPLSTEDEIRELKRRADMADQRYAEQVAKNKELEEKLNSEAKALGQALKDMSGRVEAQAALDRVPLGAMIPYFGVKPLKGYRWCNGNDPKDYPKGDNVYPLVDWVPQHLKGMPLPDMREYFVGGNKDYNEEKSVGLVYDKGILTVPETTVKGNSFKLPPSKTEELRIAAGQGNFKEGGFVCVLDRGGCTATIMQEKYGGKQVMVEDGLPTWSVGFPGLRNQPFRSDGKGTITPAPAVYKCFKDSEVLHGEQKLPATVIALKTSETNPRHVMCRWIIRVE